MGLIVSWVTPRFGHSLPTAEKSTPEGAHRTRRKKGVWEVAFSVRTSIKRKITLEEKLYEKEACRFLLA